VLVVPAPFGQAGGHDSDAEAAQKYGLVQLVMPLHSVAVCDARGRVMYTVKRTLFYLFFGKDACYKVAPVLNSTSGVLFWETQLFASTLVSFVGFFHLVPAVLMVAMNVFCSAYTLVFVYAVNYCMIGELQQ